MMHGNWMSFGHHTFLGSSLWTVLTWTVIVVGLICLFLILRKRNKTYDESYVLLKTQYVNGTITEEEYLHRKEVISRK